MVVIFNLQNSHLLTLSLPTEEVFSGKRPKSASGKFSSCRFSSSAERNANTKTSVFLLAYWFSSPSGKVGTSLSVSDTDFLVFKPT